MFIYSLTITLLSLQNKTNNRQKNIKKSGILFAKIHSLFIFTSMKWPEAARVKTFVLFKSSSLRFVGGFQLSGCHHSQTPANTQVLLVVPECNPLQTDTVHASHDFHPLWVWVCWVYKSVNVTDEWDASTAGTHQVSVQFLQICFINSVSVTYPLLFGSIEITVWLF